MDNYYQPAELLSRNRPPQFKDLNCGYRCGWGCCEPCGEGGADSESDCTPTLVGSVEEEAMAMAMEAFLLHEDIEMSPPEIIGGAEDTLPIASNDMDDSQHLWSVTVDQVSIAPPPSTQDHDESLDSLENEASSGGCDRPSSDARSVKLLPPTGWDAGIGFWGHPVADRFSLDYHFLAKPLRLSPQYEHCRGAAVSHMVAQDDIVLLSSVDEADHPF
ncbi:hypothetical protein GQ44DRAFT_696926 [Phaeosphaeriaceae sp. PMI808]|nr:hypothetical protein GQ44DRAFT_696926 [Phaeosphaeriaceae sp. PMI808]